jgi:hypothetical protein
MLFQEFAQMDSCSENWRDRMLFILRQEGIEGAQMPAADLKRAATSRSKRGSLALILSMVGVLLYSELGLLGVVITAVASFVVLSFYFGGGRYLEMTKADALLRSSEMGIDPIEQVKSAKRRPILYLRSFSFDERTTIRSVSTEQSCLASFNGWPLIAIGHPENRELVPGTRAARFYVPEKIWQQTVLELAPLCSFVIWTVGYTGHLRWELEQLMRVVKPERLIIWIHIRTPLRGGGFTPEADWNRFLNTYGTLFPKPIFKTVNMPEYLVFDKSWNPKVLPLTGNFLRNPLRSYLRGAR